MEKSFSIFENRRKVIEEKLELLVELDRILSDQSDAPYVLERHEQMEQRIADAREEISFLEKEQALAEKLRCQSPFSGAGKTRRRNRESVTR